MNDLCTLLESWREEVFGAHVFKYRSTARSVHGSGHCLVSSHSPTTFHDNGKCCWTSHPACIFSTLQVRAAECQEAGIFVVSQEIMTDAGVWLLSDGLQMLEVLGFDEWQCLSLPAACVSLAPP